ncbi:tyrosine-type recombinase/integrase [Bacillaceae bacterium IKA-2]|nr:tyrosine-type recombinase/integrase [Bacillaceae bacterium IKA-2]
MIVIGIVVKETYHEGNVGEYYTYKNVSYNKETIEEAKRKFEALKEKGIVKTNSYYDDVWSVTRNSTKESAFLKFDIDMYPDLKEGLKCFSIYELNRVTGGTVQSNLNIIKKSILISQGFDSEMVEVLEEFITESENEDSYKRAKAIINFLQFLNHDNTELYQEYLAFFSPPNPNVRKLIKFNDLLLFGASIEKFIQDCSKLERLNYYPIILWWKITNIIPTRASEFYNLKWDCLSTEGEHTILSMTRLKLRNGEIPKVSKIPISDSIKKLIEEYKRDVEGFGETTKLLSTPAYIFANKNYLGVNNIEDYSADFKSGRFSRLLNQFYNDIVIDKQGNPFNVQRLKPMDTRHYAFMNMLLQGFNPLTIARMGGHKTLVAQTHYHQHVEEFADSYVYSLTKLRSMKNYDLSPVEYVNSTNSIMQRSIIRSQNFNEYYHEVDPFGHCTYDLESYGCPFGANCKECDFFYLSKDERGNPDVIDWLQDSSTSLAKNIREQIAFMIEVSKNVKVDMSQLSWFADVDEELKRTSNNLSSLIVKKSIVDSFLEVEL